MMPRRLLAISLGLVGIMTGVVHADDDAKAKSGDAYYVHVVIFRLKKDAPAATVDRAIGDCHKMLAKIAAVRGLKAGRPAPMGTPELARKNYDFALLVLVDDYGGLKAYLEDPVHLKFVEKYNKHFDMEKTRIFDFHDQK